MSSQRKPLRSVLVKPAGPDCNMACRYCFYLDKARMFPQPEGPHRMSAEVLEATVRQVMQGGEQQVVFIWQGGEPTLMGIDFFRRAVALQRQYGHAGQVVGNGLQTNGQLIDSAWSEFLSESQFLVGLSLDGPQPIHDRYRTQHGGAATWTRVAVALARLQASSVAVDALTMVTDESARRPREIYAYLKNSGLRHMHFIPCLERDPDDPGRPAPYSVSPESYGKFLCEVFDCWLADFKGGEPTTMVRWFESVFATYVGLPPMACTLLPECGDYVVVEHTGDVYACDFFVEPQWRLGNVLTDDLAELLNSPKETEFGQRKTRLAAECQACEWLTHCQAGCPKERWGAEGELQPSHLCEAYRTFLAHADERFKALAEAWRRAQQAPPAQYAQRATQTGHGKVGRNAPCPCGSGEKYKRCCGTGG